MNPLEKIVQGGSTLQGKPLEGGDAHAKKPAAGGDALPRAPPLIHRCWGCCSASCWLSQQETARR